MLNPKQIQVLNGLDKALTSNPSSNFLDPNPGLGVLEEQIAQLEKANVHHLLETKSDIDALCSNFSTVETQLNDLETWLNHYSESLVSMQTHIEHIETKNNRTELQATNQSKLLAVLNSLLKQLDLPNDTVSILQNPQFESLSDISKSTHASYFLLNTATQEIDPQLHSMLAVKERFQYFRTLADVFGKHLADFLTSSIKQLSIQSTPNIQPQLKSKKNVIKVIDKSQFVIVSNIQTCKSNQDCWTSLIRFQKLLKWLQRVCNPIFIQLFETYCSLFKGRYDILSQELAHWLSFNRIDKGSLILEKYLKSNSGFPSVTSKWDLTANESLESVKQFGAIQLPEFFSVQRIISQTSELFSRDFQSVPFPLKKIILEFPKPTFPEIFPEVFSHSLFPQLLQNQNISHKFNVKNPKTPQIVSDSSHVPVNKPLKKKKPLPHGPQESCLSSEYLLPDVAFSIWLFNILSCIIEEERFIKTLFSLDVSSESHLIDSVPILQIVGSSSRSARKSRHRSLSSNSSDLFMNSSRSKKIKFSNTSNANNANNSSNLSSSGSFQQKKKKNTRVLSTSTSSSNSSSPANDSLSNVPNNQKDGSLFPRLNPMMTQPVATQLYQRIVRQMFIEAILKQVNLFMAISLSKDPLYLFTMILVSRFWRDFFKNGSYKILPPPIPESVPPIDLLRESTPDTPNQKALTHVESTPFSSSILVSILDQVDRMLFQKFNIFIDDQIIKIQSVKISLKSLDIFPFFLKLPQLILQFETMAQGYQFAGDVLKTVYNKLAIPMFSRLLKISKNVGKTSTSKRNILTCQLKNSNFFFSSVQQRSTFSSTYPTLQVLNPHIITAKRIHSKAFNQLVVFLVSQSELVDLFSFFAQVEHLLNSDLSPQDIRFRDELNSSKLQKVLKSLSNLEKIFNEMVKKIDKSFSDRPRLKRMIVLALIQFIKQSLYQFDNWITLCYPNFQHELSVAQLTERLRLEI